MGSLNTVSEHQSLRRVQVTVWTVCSVCMLQTKSWQAWICDYYYNLTNHYLSSTVFCSSLLQSCWLDLDGLLHYLWFYFLFVYYYSRFTVYTLELHYLSFSTLSTAGVPIWPPLTVLLSLPVSSWELFHCLFTCNYLYEVPILTLSRTIWPDILHCACCLLFIANKPPPPPPPPTHSCLHLVLFLEPVTVPCPPIHSYEIILSNRLI